jgi:hypothetical protein
MDVVESMKFTEAATVVPGCPDVKPTMMEIPTLARHNVTGDQNGRNGRTGGMEKSCRSGAGS